MQELSYTKPTITLAAALRVVEGCVQSATEMGKPMSIAVVDSSGLLKAFADMDGAPPLAERVARQKAWSAAGWDMPTMDWLKFMGEDPILIEGIPRIPGLTVLGGGVPIRAAGLLIGGVGVSGSHYTEDEEVARAGVAALGHGDTTV
jgi:uncharacterized protein GlcG (DUF336 family)